MKNEYVQQKHGGGHRFLLFEDFNKPRFFDVVEKATNVFFYQYSKKLLWRSITQMLILT